MRRTFIASMALVFLCLTACHKNNNSSDNGPVITSITPTHAPGGAEVVISGSGFLAPTVSINGVLVPITSSSSNSLQVRIPVRVGSGDIVVINSNGKTGTGPLFNYDTVWQVSTLAGSTAGYQDGPGTTALFNEPMGICIDSNQNMYVTDLANFKIRKVTPDGNVSTIAGSTAGYKDGAAASAQFGYLFGICLDATGNLYVSDLANNTIRKIGTNGIVSTFLGTAAGLHTPTGLCMDAQNNLYIADSLQILKVTPDSVVSVLAGSTAGWMDGTGTAAQFRQLAGLRTDGKGNLYAVDLGNRRICKITLSGVVTTIAQVDNPVDLCLDARGNFYITGYDDIIQLTPPNLVSILAGANGAGGYTDGGGATAQFNQPYGICIDSQTNLFVCDTYNNRIRRLEWQ